MATTDSVEFISKQWAKQHDGEPTDIDGRVYRIPVENLSALSKKVDKLNRKAEKLGATPIEFTETGADEDVETKDGAGRTIAVARFTYVIIHGEAPKLNGWAMAGVIEHLGSEGNLIRLLPEFQDMMDTTPYRQAEPWCDHCELRRKRNDTYIVVDELGETKQVGSNCLGDFTGVNDPNAAARMAQYIMEIDATARSYEQHEGATQDVTPLDEYVANVIATIRNEGWVSARQAWNEGSVATKVIAMDNMIANRRGYEAFEVTQEDYRWAHKVIDWIRETYGEKPVDERSDFEHNMAVLYSRDYLWNTGAGIVAYGPQAFKRDRERNGSSHSSQWVGSKGDKLDFEATVVDKGEWNNTYAQDIASRFVFEDSQGNRHKWFASRVVYTNIEVGAKVQVKGTVKKHEEAQGDYPKATVLTRVKLTEVR